MGELWALAKGEGKFPPLAAGGQKQKKQRPFGISYQWASFGCSVKDDSNYKQILGSRGMTNKGSGMTRRRPRE